MAYFGSSYFGSSFFAQAGWGARSSARGGRRLSSTAISLRDAGWVMTSDLSDESDEARRSRLKRERREREKAERRRAYLADQKRMRDAAEAIATAKMARRDDLARRDATSRDLARMTRMALERLDWEVNLALNTPEVAPSARTRRAKLAPPTQVALDTGSVDGVEVERRGTLPARARERVVRAHPRSRVLLGVRWPIAKARPRPPLSVDPMRGIRTRNSS